MMMLPTLTMSDELRYEGCTFGEMVDLGFDWGADNWGSMVYAITPDALAFFQPKINTLVVESFFDLHPGDENLTHFARNLRREIALAVNDNGPVLQTLFLGDKMQDGSKATSGVFNIQDDGSQGHRSATLNSDYPQSMLLPNARDYASSGTSQSLRDESNKGNLDAIMQSLGDSFHSPYADALNRVLLRVQRSGVFSAFIY